MGLFIKRGYPVDEEEAEYLVSLLPGFQGTGGTAPLDVEAMRNSDIFTAIMMIASDLAKMDIHVKRNNERVENSPIEHLLNKRPNQLYDAYTFKLIVFANALLSKHGYVEIKRNRKGEPKELHHIKTSDLKLEQSKNRTLYYRYKNTRDIDFYDVIDYKPYTLDGFTGISVLDSLKPDIEMQKHSKTFFGNYFKNGTQSGGLLKLSKGQLSPEAREKMRKEFQNANAGAQNSGKVLVLDETMDYEKFEIDTEVLKLINTSQHSTAQVAKSFGIPLHKFGIETTNMSLKDSMADYLQSTLSTYMKGITSVFEFKLFSQHSQTLEFDTETYKRVDWESYTTSVSKQYNDGVITLNEYRVKLGLPKVEKEYADTHRVSLNLVDASLVNEYQLARADNRLKGGEVNEEQGS